MIFNYPKRAPKAKQSYQNMIKAAYTETASLAIRQLHTVMHKARATFQKCRHIHNHSENSQLTEASQQKVSLCESGIVITRSVKRIDGTHPGHLSIFY